MSDEIRVLCVDDDAALLDIAAEFLERHDDALVVETESDPVAALDRIEDEQVDCVISDYEMPRVDGIELLRRVREQYPDLPFILFTGKGSEEVASEAVSAGATDYLQKETGTDQYTVLANRVTNAVSRRRAEDRVARLEAGYADLSPLADSVAAELETAIAEAEEALRALDGQGASPERIDDLREAQTRVRRVAEELRSLDDEFTRGRRSPYYADGG